VSVCLCVCVSVCLCVCVSVCLCVCVSVCADLSNFTLTTRKPWRFCSLRSLSNAHAQEGCTALHLAAEKGQLEAVEALITAKANIETVDKVCRFGVYIQTSNEVVKISYRQIFAFLTDCVLTEEMMT
jgi:hypothetical protein